MKRLLKKIKSLVIAATRRLFSFGFRVCMQNDFFTGMKYLMLRPKILWDICPTPINFISAYLIRTFNYRIISDKSCLIFLNFSTVDL